MSRLRWTAGVGATALAAGAASIPAVAAHFTQLRADGVRVLSLGMAGAFATGQKGLFELETFAHDAGGAGSARLPCHLRAGSDAARMVGDDGPTDGDQGSDAGVVDDVAHEAAVAARAE
jgi:hypothetical protein